MGNYSVVVLDFETTGLSPNCGDRAIEIGAVLIENNQIIDRFQSLMNPGMKISSNGKNVNFKKLADNKIEFKTVKGAVYLIE